MLLNLVSVTMLFTETKLTQNCVISAKVRCVLPIRAVSTGPIRQSMGMVQYGQGTGQPVQGRYGQSKGKCSVWARYGAANI